MLKRLAEKLKNLREIAAQQRGVKLSDQSGFTLTEMMIVVAIIGLIGTLVATNVMSKFDQSKVETAKIQMKQLGTALDDFRRVCGFYPTSEQGLEALVKAPMGRECKNYDPEGFIKGGKVPKDPWNNDYVLESDGSKYKIISYGSDGKAGGEGKFDKDITSDD